MTNHPCTPAPLHPCPVLPPATGSDPTTAKIIITGPGRAGTTFLIQLLTRLGFDTGYTPYDEPYRPLWRAGCEWNLEVDLDHPPAAIRAQVAAAPQILKGPEWGLTLKRLVQRGLMPVAHVFIPVRDLDEAAASRLSVGLDWHVVETDDPNLKLMDQASIHALALGRAVEACLVCDLPYTLLTFPRLVLDPDYCYDRLSQGLTIPRDGFDPIFARLANPSQIEHGLRR